MEGMALRSSQNACSAVRICSTMRGRKLKAMMRNAERNASSASSSLATNQVTMPRTRIVSGTESTAVTIIMMRPNVRIPCICEGVTLGFCAAAAICLVIIASKTGASSVNMMYAAIT